MLAPEVAGGLSKPAALLHHNRSALWHLLRNLRQFNYEFATSISKGHFGIKVDADLKEGVVAARFTSKARKEVPQICYSVKSAMGFS